MTSVSPAAPPLLGLPRQTVCLSAFLESPRAVPESADPRSRSLALPSAQAQTVRRTRRLGCPTCCWMWLLFRSRVRLQHLHRGTAPVGTRGSNGGEMRFPKHARGEAGLSWAERRKACGGNWAESAPACSRLWRRSGGWRALREEPARRLRAPTRAPSRCQDELSRGS